MQQINIHEAKTHLSRLIENVIEGDEVVIARHGKPVECLIPFKTKAVTRKSGSLAGSGGEWV